MWGGPAQQETWDLKPDAPENIRGESARDPVTPGDIAATIYHLLGVDPFRELVDPLGRPLRLCPGEPIRGVLA